MAGKQRFSKATMLAAVHDARGLVNGVARKLGCTPDTVRNYAARYPQIAEAIDDERAAVLDTAELQLITAVEKGAPWAIAFTLKTLGKHRGYVERIEQTGRDGGPIDRRTNVREFTDIELHEMLRQAVAAKSNGQGLA
jgi:predicted transcriptional regulator